MSRLCFFLFVFLSNYNCFSQTTSYSFSHLSTDDGLSQSTVIAIHQDTLGQMWIGTRDGLNKYDGSTFTVYRSEEGNVNSLSNNDILSINEDADGFLWIGTYNGLNKYNPKTGRFTRYFHNQEKSSIGNNTIWTIEILSNNEVWIGTSEGLSVYNKTTDSFTNYLYNAKKANGTQVLSILDTKVGVVFVGTGAGVFKTDLNNSMPKFSILPGSEPYVVQDLVAGLNENLLIASKNESVLNYSLKSNTISKYLKADIEEETSKNVRQLIFDDSGLLWVGTYNGLKIVNNGEVLETLRFNIDSKKGLSKNSIKYLYKDKKGSIWVGTYYGGVNIWDETNSNFGNIIQNQNGKGLNYTVVSSIEKYKNNLFFGTEGGGINVWNKKLNSYQYISKSNSSLLDDNIKALKVINHKLWVGTFKSGLNIYDLKTKQFITTPLTELVKTDIKNTGVYDVKTDALGNIWIGTFGKGLFKLNSKSQAFSRYYNSGVGKTGLSSNLVRNLCIDWENNVWVGTEKGLNRISSGDQITTFFYDKNLEYGDDILCVYEDALKHLWVGTKSKGLFKFDGLRFNHTDLLVGNVKISAIHSILEDDEGSLWISTNQGLIQYNQTQKKSKLYNQKDGLISKEFNDNASFKSDENQYYFGSPNGVTYFNPKSLAKNKYAPQVILTNFTVKENEVINKDSKKILQYTLPYSKSINLSHTQGNFSISFSIPNFINSNNNKYKYRLKGLESDWNLTSTNSTSYTIQKPGKYIFEVKGANNDNVWNTDITTLDIYVSPAPWRTWWAFTLYGLLILVSIYALLYILKSRTKLKHDLQLEHIETERAKKINTSKLEFFTNISHEFRTPLALILGPLNQIIENYQGNRKTYKKLLVIENNASHLLQLINRLMDFRKFEGNLYTLEAAEGNIIKFLKEIFLSFTEYGKSGGYDFEFVSDEKEILVYYDRNKLERVFYNLISNAFRYTPDKGHIVVRVYKDLDNIKICVEDSGVGISEEYQDKIFERFFEVAVNNKPDKDYNKGTGIGLSIAKNIVELHKGEIHVSNNVDNKGTIFTVTLALGKAHLNPSDIIKDFKFSDDVSQYITQLEQVTPVIDEDIETPHDSNKTTLLLVEDNKQLRKFIRNLLKKDYNILEAQNGEIALKKIKKEAPDLVISDVIMPKMTGTELCSFIKGDITTSHIPVILLTSRSSLIYKIDGLEHGADDYISKPFDLNEFKLRIKNLLQTREKLRQKFISKDGFNREDVIVSSVDEKLYKKALQIVSDNISNHDFDITYFSSELGVSRTMLFTKIKAWSSFTPNEFILHFRMSRAAQLLEQGKMNISEVSYTVGYKDPKYFSKCFQKKFGETPSHYIAKFLN